MTDIIIVHSKFGDSTNHWYKWLANNLILEGYDVTLFNVPQEKNGDISKWVSEMKKQIYIDKKDTYFVTHGFGTIASLEFIESLEIKKIEGLFSISGFKEDAQEIDVPLQMQHETINYDKIKGKVNAFYGLCAKDDQHVSYKETKRLMDALDGKCKITDFGGHFLEDDGFTTFTILQSKMMGIMSK
ncbi:serine hydrolase family protein [Staphylococcus nepalensis]|uniref:Serine hydrolase family protein n=1 Tax=Staphylococcus nepalensis TaxID=214473 RepID=A0A291JIR2_9STAP|nr:MULTISPECIES: alpha/beta hydrolase [Staphylococcus]ATH59774.1 alpha/beta hydrolase [Staphylococcus nepalensis]ATH64867.1 alpha/beta hydrolase [Staphylococcus nepalensis]AWI44235.1 alpha/beta hydrolase [Staphylococcus nepalensis]NWN85924.1 serine hydrolase family protein [Staphylococcus sp.]PTK60075.1 serine hydrolase family protein [Staphylococcus nepalensis]